MMFAVLMNAMQATLEASDWLLIVGFSLSVTLLYVALSKLPKRLLAAFGVAIVLAFLFPFIFIDFCQFLCCSAWCWI